MKTSLVILPHPDPTQNQNRLAPVSQSCCHHPSSSLPPNADFACKSATNASTQQKS